MLTLFKKKTALRDLIPDNHLDIHSHLLPGIDDGAKTVSDTAMLIAGMRKIGFGQFVTTPHIMNSVWENTPETIGAKLSETLSQLSPEVKVTAAAEYMMDSNFVRLFQEERLLAIHKNYVLVEMSYINPPIQLYEILFELQVAGYTPVLAHPERYTFFHKNFGEYNKLKNAGCLFQLNLLSTVGYYGHAVTEVSEKLLKAGLFDVAGSDIHHSKHLAAFDNRIIVKDIAPLKKAIAGTNRLRD